MNEKDLRARIGEKLDEITDETVHELIVDGLSAEKLKYAFYQPDPCPNCGHHAKPKKIPVDYPDYAARSKFLATFLDQAKGRPQETHKHTIDVRAGQRLDEMSDEELEAIVDGQYRELPA